MCSGVEFVHLSGGYVLHQWPALRAIWVYRDETPLAEASETISSGREVAFEIVADVFVSDPPVTLQMAEEFGVVYVDGSGPVLERGAESGGRLCAQSI